MKYTDEELFCYEFKLGNEYSSRGNYTFERREFVKSHTYHQLNTFVHKNVVELPHTLSHDRVVFYAPISDESRLEKIHVVKKFCRFLMKEDQLEKIGIQHILEKFNLEGFQEELMAEYKKFQCIELHAELDEKTKNNNTIANKKLKL